MPVDIIETVFKVVGAEELQKKFNDLSRGAGTFESVGARIAGAGVVMTGVGVGLGNINAGLKEAGNEAGAASAKLDAMLRKRGQSGARSDLDALATSLSKSTGQDDDMFTNAEAHLLSFGLSAEQVKQILPSITAQAKTMDQSVVAAADGFGRAFGSGNAGALTRTGVVLSQADKDAIKLAKSTSEVAGQTELFNRVLASYQQYAINAGEGITQAQLSQNNYNNALGTTHELLGQGIGEAQIGIYDRTASMLDRLNASPGFVKGIGEAMAYGEVIGKVVGPLVTAGGAIMKLKGGVDVLTGAKAALRAGTLVETAAEAAKVPVAGAEAAAHAATTAAVEAETLAKGGLAAANEGAMLSAFGLEGAAAAGIAALSVAAIAYAAFEGYQGTQDATTLSDEDMHKKSALRGWQADAAEESGWQWMGELTTGTGANIAKGDEAAEKSRAFMEGRRHRSNGLTPSQIAVNSAHDEEMSRRQYGNLAAVVSNRRNVTTGPNARVTRAGGGIVTVRIPDIQIPASQADRHNDDATAADYDE